MTEALKNSVVMCFDKAYGPAACVALTSLLLNSGSTDFQIDLLQTGTDPEVEQALAKLAVTFNRVVNQHDIDEHILDDFHVSNHISHTAYLRFFIPDYVHAAKALYLDCDLIVQCDVGELFAIDLAVDELVAGVEDLTGSKHAKGQLGIPDAYINSGVLLLNVERWRQEKIPQRLAAYYSENPNKITWHDQCVINGALSGKKQLLDKRFNLLLNDLLSGAIQAKDFSESTFKGIFHFNSTVKPWHSWCNPKYKVLWEKYAAVSPIAPKEVSTPRDYNEWLILAQFKENQGDYREASNIYRQLLQCNQSVS